MTWPRNSNIRLHEVDEQGTWPAPQNRKQPYLKFNMRTQPKRASIEGHGIFTGGGAAFKILKQRVGL